MDTLYVTEHWPWPARSGARLRAAATVQALAHFGNVDVLHLYRGWRYSWPEESSDLFRVAVSVLSDQDGSVAEELDPDRYPPLAVETRQSYGGQVSQWLRTHSYHMIWVNRISAWPALPPARRCPVLLDVDDLEYRLVLQGVGYDGNSRSLEDVSDSQVGSALREDAVRWRRLQATAAGDVDAVVFTSALDAARAGNSDSHVVPNVYLDTAPTAAFDTTDPHPRILLTGLFNWPPNGDAARRLVTDILPLVRQRLPKAQVWLIGEDIRGRLADLASPSVRLVGQVPDVKPFVRAADVVAVPLRKGSGTRLKILEAFALGTPVVSTRLGAEGLDLVAGEHLLTGESDRELADAIIRICVDANLAARLARNARDRVRTRHSLPALLEGVGTALEQARRRWVVRSSRVMGV